MPILVCDESDIFEKERDILRIDESVIARCHIHELFEVLFFPFEFLFAILSFEILFIVRTIHYRLHQACDRLFLRYISQDLIDHDE